MRICDNCETKKPTELKDGVRLRRYPSVRFEMCTFTYKED